MMRKWLLFFMLIVAAAAFADKYDKWVDEEVKVLITKEEKDAFKKLKSEADKEKFISEFWAKRDPSAGTPENEFRKAYEERLKIVNEKLSGGTKKAIDTDMGKTLLLLGNSSEQKVEKGDPPRQTWIYRDLPAPMNLPDVQIEFVGDPEEGGFEFANTKEAIATLDKARAYFAQLASAAASQAPPAAQAPAMAAPAPAGAAVTTPALKTALDATAAGNPPKDLPVQAITDSFMSSTGEMFATVAVNTTADTSSAAAGIRVVDGGGAVVKEVEYPFASAGEPTGYFQASIPVTAGEMSAAVAVAAGDKTGGSKLALSVPDYSSKFSLSSIILAKEFKQLPEAKQEKEPYTFGKIKVIPNITGEFAPADELIVVYEAYNFQVDPAAGKPNLEVVFSFQKDQDPPKSTPPAAPNGLVTGKKITIPTSYPLAKFPPGNYKLTVTLTDKGLNQTASSEALFTIK
jgi:GWxTD domain-containing protein